MTNALQWVLLCECRDVAELHTVRASLEARGVPVRIVGEHTHAALGMLQGAAIAPRVLVPESALATARGLVEDIMGPFAEPLVDDSGEHDGPYRGVSGFDEGTRYTPPPPQPKSIAVISLIVLMFGIGPLLGLCHQYVGQARRGMVLAVVGIFAATVFLRGEQWAVGLLAIVWVSDVVGGVLGVLAYNAKLAASQPEDEDEDEDDHYANDEGVDDPHEARA
ncbi:MAG: DUF2007 domain-containing protein [Deltaproteobacteria bacterium]|nr:DUF2007 domain-containing protein [Deltaproteobacteria bacterium]